MRIGKLDNTEIARIDEQADGYFYREPRLVTHIDEAAGVALKEWYKENLPQDGVILDLMSAYASHLPSKSSYKRVCGLGMNSQELSLNPQLSDWVVHDLNSCPDLPFADNEFDACLIAFSVQYLIDPLRVFTEIARVVKCGGLCAVPFSNRMFPTKAISIWRWGDNTDHANLVSWYFKNSSGFLAPSVSDVSPDHSRSDPLIIVSAEISEGNLFC